MSEADDLKSEKSDEPQADFQESSVTEKSVDNTDEQTPKNQTEASEETAQSDFIDRNPNWTEKDLPPSDDD